MLLPTQLQPGAPYGLGGDTRLTLGTTVRHAAGTEQHHCIAHPSHSHWLALNNLLQHQKDDECTSIIHEALPVNHTRQLLGRADLQAHTHTPIPSRLAWKSLAFRVHAVLSLTTSFTAVARWT